MVGAVSLGRGFLALERGGDGRERHDAETDDARVTGPAADAGIRRLVITAIAVAFGMAATAFLPDVTLLTLNGIPVEPIALVVAIPLVFLAAQVIAARDARRYVIGLLAAAVGWFVVFYPNIAALPLPSTIVNAYQGLLPTYLYAFPVPRQRRGAQRRHAAAERDPGDPDDRHRGDLPGGRLLRLGVAARPMAESRAAAGSGSGDGADGLARSEGGAWGLLGAKSSVTRRHIGASACSMPRMEPSSAARQARAPAIREPAHAHHGPVEIRFGQLPFHHLRRAAANGDSCPLAALRMARMRCMGGKGRTPVPIQAECRTPLGMRRWGRRRCT